MRLPFLHNLGPATRIPLTFMEKVAKPGMGEMLHFRVARDVFSPRNKEVLVKAGTEAKAATMTPCNGLTRILQAEATKKNGFRMSLQNPRGFTKAVDGQVVPIELTAPPLWEKLSFSPAEIQEMFARLRYGNTVIARVVRPVEVSTLGNRPQKYSRF